MLASRCAFVLGLAAATAVAATTNATDSAAPPALRDTHPIAADAIVYLDGNWTAVGDAKVWLNYGACKWSAGIDYNPSGQSARKPAAASSHYWMDKDQCCKVCGSTAGCAAAVYSGPVWQTGSFLGTARDIA